MAEKVPYPDHPDRCQGINSAKGEQVGQCTLFKVPGSDFCSFHGGNKKAQADTLQELNLYRLKKFTNRLVEFKNANGARTIDEELAILRMVLEETVNKCNDEMELLLYSTKISELINDIKGLVISADKLATKARTTIGRSEAIVIAGKTVEIITRHIDDPAILAKIAEDITQAFITTEDEDG